VLLLDNSAWARLLGGGVAVDRAKTIAEWMERGELAVCLPFLLEAGYSARSGADRMALMARFAELPTVTLDKEIAACAHRAEAGVLHYDGDYDVLAEHTSLMFESEWLAPAGAL